MIPGIMAGQMRVAGGGPSPVRPVYLANSAAAASSGTLATTLPSGWAAGDLAVLAVVSNPQDAFSLSGWTAVGGVVNNTGHSAHLFWRILQAGDAGPVIPDGQHCAIIWLFQAGTFNPTTPLVETASATGTSATASVAAGSSVPAGLDYQMQFWYAYGSLSSSPLTYPLASGQRVRTVGASFDITHVAGCGADFDGGATPAGSYGMSASNPWVSRKVAIIGYGSAAP